MKRNNTVKDRRAYKALNTSFNKKEFRENELPTCPYCGGKMKLKSTITAEGKNKIYLECINNDAMHDVRCEVIKTKFAYKYLSTPADKKLRYLRQEAHFYMNLLVRNQIFKSIEDAYAYIDNNSLFGSGYKNAQTICIGNTNTGSIGMGKTVHIGFLKEYGCQDVIRICINLLHKNLDRLTYITRHGNPHYEPEDLKVLLDEMMEYRRVNNI